MKTIAQQILTAMLLVMLVVIGGVGYLDLQRSNQLQQAHLERDQRQVVQRLSYSLASPFWQLSRSEVDRVIENEAVDEDVRAILVYDQWGMVYAGVVRERINGVAVRFDPTNRLHQDLIGLTSDAVSESVNHKQKNIGRVVLYANVERLQANINAERLQLVLKLVVLFAALAIMLFIVLRRIVIRPLTRVREWVSMARPGKALPPLKVAYSEEVDALANAFVKMTGRLQSSMSEIEQLNTQLEERVKERTAQLEVANTALSLARDLSEAATLAKSRFLANMSHEIRTPMNSILGYAQLMQRLPHLTGDVAQYVGMIARSGDHLLALINDVLEMSKIEAGGTTLAAEDFELIALMKDVESMLGIRAAEKALSLTFKVAPEIPRTMFADTTKLRQVLVNIVGNAIKFTDRGHIEVNASLRGIDAQGKATVTIDISDSGPGIASHEHSKVFESFEQTSSGLHKGGTGLGMAISRQYARMMGGDISFTSVVGHGTTVHFSFTAQKKQGPDSPWQSPEKKLVARLLASSTRPRILIVDDVESNRDVLRLMLLSMGFVDIREVSDGIQVQSAVQEWLPEFIFMDRRMPGMDGFEASRLVRTMSQGKHIRIVMVSASAFKDDVPFPTDSGIDGFISKPFRYEEVLAELQRLCPSIAYEYATIESARAENLSPAIEGSTDADLPPDVAAALAEFIDCGDIVRFEKAVAERVAPTLPQLAEQLTALAVRFDYAGILARLKPNPPL